jgi:hypothetical protein
VARLQPPRQHSMARVEAAGRRPEQDVDVSWVSLVMEWYHWFVLSGQSD